MQSRFIVCRYSLMFALGFLGCIFFAPAVFADELFLRLTGIPGESTDPQHLNDIDLQSFNWEGVVLPLSTGGGGSGKSVFHDISFTKPVDKSSPKLMLSCAKGDHITTATIFVRKAGAPSDYFVIELTDAIITSYSSSGSQQSIPTDHFSFTYRKIRLTYTRHLSAGGPDEVITARWDVAGNIGF